MIFRKQKFDAEQLKINKFIPDVKQLKMNKFISGFKQLNIKAIWQVIISISHATLEVL